MPAISFTTRDLRQILENSRNYEAFSRNRPLAPKIPTYDHRHRQIRQRSRSRSKSRSRARSVSYSRVPNRLCRCCDSTECRNRKSVPPGLPRPSSAAKNRPGSAKLERPRSAQARLDNVKATLPPRPSSAHTRSRHQYPDPDPKSIDYSGLSNMVRTLNLQPTRKWKSKSPNRENIIKKKPEVVVTAAQEEEKVFKDTVVSSNMLRKSRSSSYSKFKYPEKYHSSPFNKHLLIEGNIPTCLRKFPRYINQPKRHNCCYNPQGSAVSWVTSHNIRSGNLPPQIAHKTMKSRDVQRHLELNTTHDVIDYDNESFNVIGLDTARDVDAAELDDVDRNGTYQYVYQPPSSQSQDRQQPRDSDVVLDMDDIDGDETHRSHKSSLSTSRRDNRNQKTKSRNQNTQKQQHNPRSDLNALKDDYTRNCSPAVISDNDDDVIDNLSDNSVTALGRTDSQDEFEKLMNQIENNTGSNDVRSPSPTRPETPLSDFHDDDDVNGILNRPISPVYSDVESIPEDID